MTVGSAHPTEQSREINTVRAEREAVEVWNGINSIILNPLRLLVPRAQDEREFNFQISFSS